MRILVDRDLCQGHAMCELEAPEVFTVPKSGTVEVLVDEPSPDQDEAVRLAVQYCPTKALSLTSTRSLDDEETSSNG
jgi:ferredoxin